MFKVFLIVACFALFSGAALADVTGTGYKESAQEGGKGAMENVEGDVKNTMQNAQEAHDEAAEIRFEEMVPKPEEVQKQANQCLDGIMDADFGFGMNVPSAKDMMGAACDKINSEVKGYLTKKSKEFSADYFDGLIGSKAGAGLGYSAAPRGGTNYDQKGDEMADSLWEEIERDKPWLEN